MNGGKKGPKMSVQKRGKEGPPNLKCNNFINTERRAAKFKMDNAINAEKRAVKN